jgi:hypothetical protein
MFGAGVAEVAYLITYNFKPSPDVQPRVVKTTAPNYPKKGWI